MLKPAILKAAILEAGKTNYRYRVGAILFKSGRIYSRGHNYYQRSAKSLNPRCNWYGSIHAEVACIINARRDLSNLDMLVVRVRKSNTLGLSKPCKECQKYLKYVGVRNIYFSTGNSVEIEKLILDFEDI